MIASVIDSYFSFFVNIILVQSMFFVTVGCDGTSGFGGEKKEIDRQTFCFALLQFTFFCN
jgi:hypothetical protein